MTDRELLELAAKAAGIKKDDSPYNGGGEGNDGFDCMGNMVTDWHNNKRWNPLADDGDAQRLAVRLRLTVSWDKYDDTDYATATARHTHQGYDCVVDQDPYAASRRAVVRAAAAMGEAL